MVIVTVVAIALIVVMMIVCFSMLLKEQITRGKLVRIFVAIYLFHPLKKRLFFDISW
jgi:hypothetical protein